MKDGIGCGGYLGATELAAIDLPARNAKVFGDALALGTGDTLRPSGVFEELKAGVFIWELGIELLYGILSHVPMLHGEHVLSRDNHLSLTVEELDDEDDDSPS